MSGNVQPGPDRDRVLEGLEAEVDSGEGDPT